MKKILFAITVFTLMLHAQNQPYTILISFDAFRWDYPQRGLSPNLEKIAQNGVSALSLKPCFPSKTFPNHLSIITGMYPENHGIILNGFEDPFTKHKYKLNDSNEVRNSRWYWGEPFWETAKRQGIKTASFFWPGSEMTLEYRRSDIYKKYEHNLDYNRRVSGVLAWLNQPIEKRPRFISMYFDATDTYGHKYGPNSKETNDAIKNLDLILGKLLAGLKDLSIIDSTNIIVVSDHGMAEVSKERWIHLETVLKNVNYKPLECGVISMIECDDKKLDEVYSILKANENHYKVYKREDVPSCYHFSKNPFIAKLVIIPETGWMVMDKKFPMKFEEEFLGNHGFDNGNMDMHGIFFAMGPSFKKNYKTGTINNIDIYPMLCKIYNIFPRNNIDGKLENIEFILK